MDESIVACILGVYCVSKLVTFCWKEEDDVFYAGFDAWNERYLARFASLLGSENVLSMSRPRHLTSVTFVLELIPILLRFFMEIR